MGGCCHAYSLLAKGRECQAAKRTNLEIPSNVKGMTKETDKIKVPSRTSTSRVEKALKNIPLDGQWHELLEMGFTVAEQTARGYNVPGGSLEFGYTHRNNAAGELISVLWVRNV